MWKGRKRRKVSRENALPSSVSCERIATFPSTSFVVPILVPKECVLHLEVGIGVPILVPKRMRFTPGGGNWSSTLVLKECVPTASCWQPGLYLEVGTEILAVL